MSNTRRAKVEVASFQTAQARCFRRMQISYREKRRPCSTTTLTHLPTASDRRRRAYQAKLSSLGSTLLSWACQALLTADSLPAAPSPSETDSHESFFRYLLPPLPRYRLPFSVPLPPLRNGVIKNSPVLAARSMMPMLSLK